MQIKRKCVQSRVYESPGKRGCRRSSCRKRRVSNERISIVDDDATKLKLYNVVVGSFSVKTNASSLKERLIQDGYGAFTARNNQMMFRVIAGSFDTRKEAEELRDAIKLKYSPEFSDAWLLINR